MDHDKGTTMQRKTISLEEKLNIPILWAINIHKRTWISLVKLLQLPVSSLHTITKKHTVSEEKQISVDQSI
jgi:hypothetical protein